MTLLTAYHAGTRTALNLKPGDVWIGSMPSAIAAGYGKGTVGYEVFQAGFLDHVRRRWPKGVLVDAETNAIIDERSE